jgi:hypothetical protein
LDQVMKDLAALTDRVGRLEQDNTQLKTENATLKAENDRLEATSEYLKDNATVTRKQLAQDGPKVAEAERITKAAEWASRISWKADTRYRYESVDPEAAVEQQRQRIRARLSMTAKINDTLTGTIGIATNGGTGDPRSTNQTLGDSWTRKGIGLDLAYVDWKPVDSFGMSFGKMPQPWYKVAGYFFDNDINPEGIAARFATGPFFANAWGMALSERSTASDASLLGGQIGLTGQIGGMKLTGALGYFDVGSVQGQVTTALATPVCAANPAFFAGSTNGNTTVGRVPDAGQRLQRSRRSPRRSLRSPTSRCRFAQYIQNDIGRPRHRLAAVSTGEGRNPRSRGRLCLRPDREGLDVRPVRGLGLRWRRDGRRRQHLQGRLRARQELGPERHLLHERPLHRRPGRNPIELRPLPGRPELEVLRRAVTRLS